MKIRRGKHPPLLESLEPRVLLSALSLPHLHRARPVLTQHQSDSIYVIPTRQRTASNASQVRLSPAVALAPAAMSAPVASLAGANAAEIRLAATAPSGGTGNYTYQWHRGTTAGFAPSPETAIAGATGLAFVDGSNTAAGVPYFYLLAASDGSTTRYSNQVIGALDAPTIPIGLPYQPRPVLLASMGSSTWAINQGSGQVPAMIDARLRAAFPGFAITSFNGAVSGTQTLNFLPGQPQSNALKAAVSGFNGYKVLRMMIGSNDAAAGRPASAWLASMQAIINDALTWPVDAIILEEIGVRLDGGNATIELLRQYNAVRSSLAGPKVFLGTAHTFENQAIHLAQLSGDKIHQSDAGQVALAAHQAAEVRALFTAPAELELAQDGASYGLAADPAQTVLRLTRDSQVLYQYPLATASALSIHLTGSNQILSIDYGNGGMPGLAITSIRANHNRLDVSGANEGQSFELTDYQLVSGGATMTYKNISGLRLTRGTFSYAGGLSTLDNLEVGEGAIVYWQ
jgi:hypothetical protein